MNDCLCQGLVSWFSFNRELRTDHQAQAAHITDDGVFLLQFSQTGDQLRAAAHGIPLVFDGSLISENAYFIKQREAAYADRSIREILAEMMDLVDIFYMSARKSTSVRGGMIATNRKEYYDRILAWLPVYEGFATYGGMSIKEVEAMAVGLRGNYDPKVPHDYWVDYIRLVKRKKAPESPPSSRATRRAAGTARTLPSPGVTASGVAAASTSSLVIRPIGPVPVTCASTASTASGCWENCIGTAIG